MKLITSKNSSRNLSTIRSSSPATTTTASNAPSPSSDRTTLSNENQGVSNGRLSGLMAGLQENYSSPRGTGGDAVTEAAEANYGRHGDQPHDLSDRRQVGQLISRSPQNDDMEGPRRTTRAAGPGQSREAGRVDTNNDDHRCGGAAIMNSLLLDGGHRNNANALEQVANRRASERDDFSVSPEQRRALAHMRDGSLTPRETAMLQEMTYDMSHTGNQEGLNDSEMANTVRDLRRAGALQNTEQANFRLQDNNGTPHWTVSTRTNHGDNFADSLPQDNGYATVTGGQRAAFAPNDQQADRPYQGSVVLDRSDANDERVRVRRPSARGVEQTNVSVDQNQQWGPFPMAPGEMSSN